MSRVPTPNAVRIINGMLALDYGFDLTNAIECSRILRDESLPVTCSMGVVSLPIDTEFCFDKPSPLKKGAGVSAEARAMRGR